MLADLPHFPKLTRMMASSTTHPRAQLSVVGGKLFGEMKVDGRLTHFTLDEGDMALALHRIRSQTQMCYRTSLLSTAAPLHIVLPDGTRALLRVAVPMSANVVRIVIFSLETKTVTTLAVVTHDDARAWSRTRVCLTAGYSESLDTVLMAPAGSDLARMLSNSLVMRTSPRFEAISRFARCLAVVAPTCRPRQLQAAMLQRLPKETGAALDVLYCLGSIDPRVRLPMMGHITFDGAPVLPDQLLVLAACATPGPRAKALARFEEQYDGEKFKLDSALFKIAPGRPPDAKSHTLQSIQ